MVASGIFEKELRCATFQFVGEAYKTEETLALSNGVIKLGTYSARRGAVPSSLLRVGA